MSLRGLSHAYCLLGPTGLQLPGFITQLVERGMRVVFFPRLEEILDHISSLPPWKKNTIKDENLNQRKEKEIKKGQGKDLFKPLYL